MWNLLLESVKISVINVSWKSLNQTRIYVSFGRNICCFTKKSLRLERERERAREKKERLDRSLKNIDFILENFSPKLKEKIQRA